MMKKLIGDDSNTFWFKNIHDFNDRLGLGEIRIIDRIGDFKSGRDTLSFQGFDTNPTDIYSPTTFRFIGNNVAFKKDSSSQLMFSSQSNSLVCDFNGDGKTDFTIKIAGISALQASDFIF